MLSSGCIFGNTVSCSKLAIIFNLDFPPTPISISIFYVLLHIQDISENLLLRMLFYKISLFNSICLKSYFLFF